MMHRIFSRALRAAPLVACAIVPPVACADTAPIDITSIPVDGRLGLARATLVKLPTGRVATVGALLVEHELRTARIAARAQPAPEPAQTRSPVGSDFVYFGNGGMTVRSLHAPVPATVPKPPLTLVATEYANRGWAAPYVAYCSRETASVCLEIPGPNVYALNYPATGVMSEIDPFLASQDCVTAGGVEHRGYCLFSYPMAASVRFHPGLPPSAEKIGTCTPAFVGKIDPKGLVSIAFDPTSYTADANENATFAATQSCYVRIYAPDK